MAHAYQNVTSGQVVVSDEPRPDLEALARWEKIPVPAAATPTPPAGAAPTSPPPTGEPAGSGEDGKSPESDAGSTPPAEPVPDESWTHEQLDELAEKREIKFPSNTNKAAKVAALTAPAGE